MEEVVRPTVTKAAEGAETRSIMTAVAAGLDIADTPDLDPVDRAFIKHFRRSLQASGPRLPPMPETVLRIDRVLAKPGCSVSEVAEVIRADAAVATKIVGIANSPFFAGLGRVRSVDGAITRMGLRETKSIVQAIALGSRLMRVPGREAEVERLYRHTVAVAVAARAVAVRVRMDGDTAFLAGLVHDIGRLVFLAAVGDFERASARKQTPSAPLVEALSNALHEDLSALVARAWRVGNDIEAAVRHHEAPEHAPADDARLAQVIAAADDLARYTLEPESAARPVEDVLRLRLLESLGIRDVEALLRDVVAGEFAFELPVVEPAAFDAFPEVVSTASLAPPPALTGR